MSESQLNQYLDQDGTWMQGEGPESDIVISSRACLARNVEGKRFSHHAEPEERKELHDELRQRISSIGRFDSYDYVDLEECDDIDSSFLVERHLITRELAEADWSRGVAIQPDESSSIMINEQDHLLMQVLRSGFRVQDTWEYLDEMDDLMEETVQYAFSSKYGYLTASPTSAGTALRVSATVHLPVLELTDHMDKVYESLSRVHFAAQPLYGEGAAASGDLFRIYNKATLNSSEQEFTDQLAEMVEEIVQFEREWRDRMMEEEPNELEDRVWRAVGTLTHARSLSVQEASHCLSALRLGVTMEILEDIPLFAINRMFVMSLPGHLQKQLNLELDPEVRDRRRANYLRDAVADFV